MSDFQDISSEADQSPTDRAHQAMNEAVEDLQQAHEQAEDAAEAGMAENEAVNGLVEDVARALVDGMNEPVGLFAGAVADECRYYTKTDIKQNIKDRAEELAREETDREPLDAFIQDRLEKVIIVKTTDHKQGAEYIWDFGRFKVETESGSDGRAHFHWPNFREYILESGGVNVGRPTQDRRDGEDWRDFMVEIVEERGETRKTRGPRTRVVERLTNRIKDSRGWGTGEATLDKGGVWVRRDRTGVPEWWAAFGGDPSEERDCPADLVREIRVPDRIIESLVEDEPVTRSGLYHELSARGHTIPGMDGASLTEYINGSEERFWALLPSIGTPRRYTADPYTENHPVRFNTFETDTQERESQQTDGPTPDAEPSTERMEADGNGSKQDDDGFDSVGDAE